MAVGCNLFGSLFAVTKDLQQPCYVRYAANAFRDTISSSRANEWVMLAEAVFVVRDDCFSFDFLCKVTSIIIRHPHGAIRRNLEARLSSAQLRANVCIATVIFVIRRSYKVWNGRTICVGLTRNSASKLSTRRLSGWRAPNAEKSPTYPLDYWTFLIALTSVANSGAVRGTSHWLPD